MHLVFRREQNGANVYEERWARTWSCVKTHGLIRVFKTYEHVKLEKCEPMFNLEHPEQIWNAIQHPTGNYATCALRSSLTHGIAIDHHHIITHGITITTPLPPQSATLLTCSDSNLTSRLQIMWPYYHSWRKEPGYPFWKCKCWMEIKDTLWCFNNDTLVLPSGHLMEG